MDEELEDLQYMWGLDADVFEDRFVKEPVETDPEEITKMVEAALSRFPQGILADDQQVEDVFDVIYDAIELAIARAKQ